MNFNLKRCLVLFLLPVFILTALNGCQSYEYDKYTEDKTDLQVYCFSAGKADAFLLTTDNSAVLIDTAEKDFGSDIVSYLQAAGIDRIDYLILTHFDKDHVGGAGWVINTVLVDTVLQSNYPKDSSSYKTYVRALEDAGIEPITVRETYSFKLDNIIYTVYPPEQEVYGSSESNNSSLIISVTNGDNNFLFTGDAENERLEEFLAHNTDEYDFLKVPYHGHWQKRLDDLVYATNPKYAVITSSDEELEDEQTVELLSEMGTQIFLTRTAPVVIHSDGEALSVSYIK